MSRHPDDLRALRRRAAGLFEQGVAQAGVARALGISRVTALSWYRIWRETGREGLLAASRRGRRPKLDAEQLARIDAALTRKPASWGFAIDTWSLAAIAALIQRLTGITHHPRHVGRLLRRMGWIVPPIGDCHDAAMRIRFFLDPDGNRLCLLSAPARSARRSP